MTTVTTQLGAWTPSSRPVDGWTVDDLDDLPEDDGLRYELVDGSLLVSPSPDLGHDDLWAQLLVVLAQALPADWRVAQPGLYFDERNYRVPDLAVYRRSALAGRRLGPGDVALVVELVSPSTRSTDRVAKPAQYAAAGVPQFWRLERDPWRVVVHELVGDAYRVVAELDDEVTAVLELDEPVTVSFRLPDLLP